MSAQILAGSEADYVAPAMRMWEWFDMWALYEEWRSSRGVLVENDDEDTGPDSDSMSPDEQHDFYHKHFQDVLTDHTRMDRESRKGRWKEVEQWAREKGIAPEAAKRVRSGGHDIKSAHAGFHLLDAALRSGQHGHKLAKAAKKSREDKTLSKSTLDNRAEVMAHLMTRHGHAQSGEDPVRLRKVHKRLEDREKFMGQGGKKWIDPHSEHGYDKIAADHDMTADEVRSIAQTRLKGGHLTPIRNLAKQALSHVEKGGKLDHEWVASGAARLIKMRNKALEGENRKANRLKAAVNKGSAEIQSKEDGKAEPVLHTATHTPGQARTALRVARPTKTNPVLHHPDSKKAKEGHETLDSVDAHETLADRLGIHKKKPIRVHDAIHSLYKKGEKPEAIAKALKTPLSSVEGVIMGRRSGPGKAKDSGGSPGNPTLAKVSGSEEDAKKSRALPPSKAVGRDLHDLYPLRRPGKEGEADEEKTKRHGDFAERVKRMYHGDPEKGVPAKPHLKDAPAKDVEKVGQFGSPSKAHAGFAGAGKGGLDLPGEHKDSDFEHKVFDVEAARKKYKGDEAKVEAARKKHEEERAAARAKHAEKTLKGREAHKAKADKFHDTLASSHEGVHKAVAPILAAMADPKHPENVRHREHYSALKSAELSGDKNRVKQLEKEGKEKRLHPDLLQHHLNLAADDPEVHKHLGVTTREHARTALGNIFKRVETHGKNYMKTAIAHGAGEQKARGGAETDPKRRQLHRPGDSLSRARIRVPGEGGGDVESPTHKPEKFIEPEKKPTVADRVLDKRAQQDRSAHVPGAIDQQQREAGRGRARARAATKPPVQSASRTPGPRGPSEVAKRKERLASADIHTAQTARAQGHEPGTPQGRTPTGADPEKLLRIRPARPGTGSAVTAPVTGKEPPARSAKDKLDRAFGERTRKPGVVVQRAETGRSGPLANVRFVKKQPSQEPKQQEESLFVRTPLALTESRSLFSRLTDLV